jgi:hypothetical protein
MSPTATATIIATAPAATAAVAFAPDDLRWVEVPPDRHAPVPADDVQVDVVEREELRLEFEAIIAAGYRGGADEPRPAPPPRRVATTVGGARPVARSAVPSGPPRSGRPGPGPAAGPAPRERGPPASA